MAGRGRDAGRAHPGAKRRGVVVRQLAQGAGGPPRRLLRRLLRALRALLARPLRLARGDTVILTENDSNDSKITM
jgi:hypothetical protein